MGIEFQFIGLHDDDSRTISREQSGVFRTTTYGSEVKSVESDIEKRSYIIVVIRSNDDDD